MRNKKICLSTQLSELYGTDHYQSHIEVGREYWYNFWSESNICKIHGDGWYKIKVTYIRSGCMFYVFSDYPDMEEEFCPLKCFFASTLTVAELDPIKDLGEKIENIEVAKLMYYFDTEHTNVKNWPNEPESEVNDDYGECISTLMEIFK